MGALRKLHAWAGLALCLLLVPLALSGAALVFKPEWLRATVPHAAASVTTTPETAARAMAAAEARFGKVASVTFAGPEIGLHQVRAGAGGGYLRPADGAVVQTWGKNERAVDWLFDLHHHLLYGKTGQKVAGFAGLAAAVMVLTGLVLWAPAWRSFRWRVTPGGGRAGWLSAHRDLGVIAAPMVLVLTLTGAPVALSDLTAKALGFERPEPPRAGVGAPDWPRVLAAAQARFPGAALRSAALPARPGRAVVVRLRQPGEWHVNGRTVVHVDPVSAQVLLAEDALAKPGAERIYNALWPVHANRVGGLAWSSLCFLGGLSLAALALYGAESYRRKLFPVRPRRPAARAPLPASPLQPRLRRAARGSPRRPPPAP